MNTILIALAFVGGLVGLILVGMMLTMYFYTHGALGLTRFRGAKGLQALAARSVPFQVSLVAGESEINLALSSDPGAPYASVKMLVIELVFLMIVFALISVSCATI